jgi:hypothetical protein
MLLFLKGVMRFQNMKNVFFKMCGLFVFVYIFTRESSRVSKLKSSFFQIK